MRNKSTNGQTGRTRDAELDGRIRDVRQKLIEGFDTQDILDYVQQTWGVHFGTAYNYLGRARAEVQRLCDEDQAEALAMALARRGFLYQRCVAIGDYPGALRAEQDAASLRGLYPRDRAALARAGLDDATKQAIKEVESPLAAVLRAAAVARGVTPPAVPQEGADGGGA